MKTRLSLFIFSIFIPIALCAQTVHIKKGARTELTQLIEYARTLMAQDKTGSLVAHYMNPDYYLSAKQLLSHDQQTRLIRYMQMFDQSFAFSKGKRRQAMELFFVGLRDEIESLPLFDSYLAPAQRTVPKKNYPVHAVQQSVEQKQWLNQSRHEFNPDNDMLAAFLQQMHNVDPQELEQAAHHMQQPNPVSGLLGMVMNNKEKIAMGLATAYALLAKANDWPPYDKKPMPLRIGWTQKVKNGVSVVGRWIGSLDNG